MLIFTLINEQIRNLSRPARTISCDPVVLLLQAMPFYDARGAWRVAAAWRPNSNPINQASACLIAT